MSDDPPKLSLISEHLPPDKLKTAVDGLLRSEEDMIRFHQYMARMHRAKYLALIDAGFTEDEALELCRSLRT